MGFLSTLGGLSIGFSLFVFFAGSKALFGFALRAGEDWVLGSVTAETPAAVVFARLTWELATALLAGKIRALQWSGFVLQIFSTFHVVWWMEAIASNTVKLGILLEVISVLVAWIHVT